MWLSCNKWCCGAACLQCASTMHFHRLNWQSVPSCESSTNYCVMCHAFSLPSAPTTVYKTTQRGQARRGLRDAAWTPSLWDKAWPSFIICCVATSMTKFDKRVLCSETMMCVTTLCFLLWGSTCDWISPGVVFLGNHSLGHAHFCSIFCVTSSGLRTHWHLRVTMLLALCQDGMLGVVRNIVARSCQIVRQWKYPQKWSSETTILFGITSGRKESCFLGAVRHSLATGTNLVALASTPSVCQLAL